MNTTVVDGPPGSGKTTRIVATAPLLAGRTCVVTYTKEAARTVLTRDPSLTAGTIYSLTWPLVRRYGVRNKQTQVAAPHTTRPIRNEFDAALDGYSDRAPSRRQRNETDEMAERLHAWNGAGAPPFDLDAANPNASALRWLLPIAKWHAAGCPNLTPESLYANVIVDEAQDMGTLELATAQKLLAPGGHLICYGDPGQALYAESKGLRGGILPAAWRLDGERETLTGGHRCGDPLASAAARVLNPIWRRPASTFCAPHRTEIVEWWPNRNDAFAPGSLVLGYSRDAVKRFIEEWGLKRVALVPSLTGAARLTVCTGHAAKGAEAEQVFLLPWSQRALARLDEQEPSALRLLYTMLTRARRRIFIPATLLARMQ